MFRLFDRAFHYFVPARLREDADRARQAQLALVTFTAMAVATLVFSLPFFRAGRPGIALYLDLLAALALLLLFWLRRSGALELVANLGLALLFVGVTSLLLLRGGLDAPAAMAMGLPGMLGVYLVGWRNAFGWTLLALLTLSGVAALPQFGVVLSDQIPNAQPVTRIVAPLNFVLLLFVLSLASERLRKHATLARDASTARLAQAEQQRLAAEREAQLLRADRMASVGQLAAGVAHEVNSPLAYLIGNIAYVQEQLDEQLEPGELHAALAEAREGAERVKYIVTELKTFSHVDEERVQPVIVEPVLESTLRIAESELRHRARIVRDYGAIPPIAADEARLAQVLLNLLLNAAQATAPGDPHGNTVTLRTALDESGQVVIEVSDTGQGIPAEVLPRVTEPFFTTKPIGQGTGLGLSVCKNIVEAYGGTLSIQSKLGVGTSVRLQLPPAGPGCRPGGGREAVRPAVKSRRARVLLVDDDPLVLRSLARVLREHDVTAVDQGARALELLQGESEFDLVICDLMMPGHSGMDVYHFVQERRPELAKRMVFLTGGAVTEDAQQFFNSVNALRLAKPFDPIAVRELVQNAL